MNLKRGSLRCPFCGASPTEVLHTNDKGDVCTRRRRCLACDYRWTTDERYGVVPPGRKISRPPPAP